MNERIACFCLKMYGRKRGSGVECGGSDWQNQGREQGFFYRSRDFPKLAWGLGFTVNLRHTSKSALAIRRTKPHVREQLEIDLPIADCNQPQNQRVKVTLVVSEERPPPAQRSTAVHEIVNKNKLCSYQYVDIEPCSAGSGDSS